MYASNACIIISVVEVAYIDHDLNFSRNDVIKLWTNQKAAFEIDLFYVRDLDLNFARNDVIKLWTNQKVTVEIDLFYVRDCIFRVVKIVILWSSSAK